MFDQFLSRTNCSISPDWHEALACALSCMDQDYLKTLIDDSDWLPGVQNMLAAFSMPMSSVRYILLGESPYPRAESANGYAFYDEAVGSLWSDTGFSKAVNRATSLRNFLKMLLCARGDLLDDCSQGAIAKLDKSVYCQTASDFFEGLMTRGFLLLNATLVYQVSEVKMHAKKWQPFMNSLFLSLEKNKKCRSVKGAPAQCPTNNITLILLGRIAASVDYPEAFSTFQCEHPYNISFITNPNVVQFFKPLDLLHRYDSTFNHQST